MYISKMKILSEAQLSQVFSYLSDFHAAANVNIVGLPTNGWDLEYYQQMDEIWSSISWTW